MADTDLQSLARRVEEADGPDRELDALIAVATYSDIGHADPRDNTHARLPSRSDECAPGTYWISAFSGLSLRTAPAYTASLDAALTLVPEEWGYSICPTSVLLTRSMGDAGVMGRAGTPALALTAACLRALSHKDLDHG